MKPTVLLVAGNYVQASRYKQILDAMQCYQRVILVNKEEDLRDVERGMVCLCYGTYLDRSDWTRLECLLLTRGHCLERVWD